MMYDWGYGNNYGFWDFVFMLLTMTLIVVGVLLVIRLVARDTSSGASSKGQETALDILQKRYAKGEIDKDEYEEKRKVLSK